MKIASAFSGGFGSQIFALKYLGIEYEEVFACEWMKPQRESYILNHGEPTSNFYEDIMTFDGTKYKGEIDYYHLSPPCQEYSMAGNRGGADTDKGQLMFQAIKSIDEVQPKMFSVENVRGLLSSNGGEDWKNILKDFNSLKGYTISWGIMNAKEQGTPQNRERVFIVGFRGPGVKMSFPQKQPLQYVLKDLLEDEIDEKYFLSQKSLDRFTRSSRSVEPGTRDTKTAQTVISQYAKIPTDGFYIREELNQIGNIDTKGHNSLWGRVYDTNGIAPTQNAKGGGAGAKTGLFQEEKRIRRLTPRECARVQGDFKDMFKFGKASDTKLYEFIGNAMDISTTKNLITKMLIHLKNVNITDANEPSFNISTKDKQKNLFN